MFLLLALALPLLSAAAPLPPDGLPTPYPQPPKAQRTTFTLYVPSVQKNAVFFTGPTVSFGYGWGVYNWRWFRPNEVQNYGPTSFNWVKMTDNPGNATAELCDAKRIPHNVLLRLNKAEAGVSPQAVGDDAYTWAVSMEDAPGVGKCVEAFEIGNEPNLSGPGLYNGPVDPEAYADQLCAAHDAIKGVDPSFIVVSGGLAPTTSLFPDETIVMDEEAFLRRMLTRIGDTHAGDAGACFDILAYHNYGFRTGHLTEPSDDPYDPDCPDGMCFRGVERIQTILWIEFGVPKKIWATEVGWLRDFNVEGCLARNPGVFGNFVGFENTDQEQADELVGAFQYARANWQWVGAMFVFNLDFNQREWWKNDHCIDEQGWFAVQGLSDYEHTYAAKAALEALEKLP